MSSRGQALVASEMQAEPKRRRLTGPCRYRRCRRRAARAWWRSSRSSSDVRRPRSARWSNAAREPQVRLGATRGTFGLLGDSVEGASVVVVPGFPRPALHSAHRLYIPGAEFCSHARGCLPARRVALDQEGSGSLCSVAAFWPPSKCAPKPDDPSQEVTPAHPGVRQPPLIASWTPPMCRIWRAWRRSAGSVRAFGAPPEAPIGGHARGSRSCISA